MAAKGIKGRLLKKNAKVQMLSLELLDMGMTKCRLPFAACICTKDFMNVLIRLIMMKDIPPPVKEK